MLLLRWRRKVGKPSFNASERWSRTTAVLLLLMLLLLQSMAQLSNHVIAPAELARLGQKAEWDYGVKSGILDQFAIANGKKGEVSFIDTRSLKARPLRIDLPDHQFLIGFTRERALGSEFNRRTEESAAAAKARQKSSERDLLSQIRSFFRLR